MKLADFQLTSSTRVYSGQNGTVDMETRLDQFGEIEVKFMTFRRSDCEKAEYYTLPFAMEWIGNPIEDYDTGDNN